MTINITDTATIGKTNLQVNRFGLGAAHIPKGGAAMAVQTVEAAIAQGVTFIDTAPLYGAGLSETYVGQALAGVPRDSYVLGTKVGRLIRDGKPIFDFSRDGILRSLEESLQRLKLAYVDILHIHDPDNHYRQALDEAFPTLADLRSQGVIKAIGSGMNQWQMLGDFARNADFDCFLLAGRYTLLEQTSLAFLDLCHEKRISVIAAGVYNSGILVSNLGAEEKYNYSQAPVELRTRAHQLSAVCERHGVPLNVAAIQFPYGHPAIATMVVGAESPEEVATNVVSVQASVPAALWADLQAKGLLAEGTPTPQ